VDAAHAGAFPLQIFFSGGTGSFQQSALAPELSSFALMAGAAVAWWMRRRRA